MTVLSRYMFLEFLKAVAACILSFMLLYLVIDFADNADRLIRNNAGIQEIGWYYLSLIPKVFVMTSPVATMLAVLIVLSMRIRGNELTAMYSGGCSLTRICAPIMVGCALVSMLSLLCSEILAPAANRQAHEIKRARMKPGSVAAQFSGKRYWMRGEEGILSATVVDSASKSLSGFMYYELDRQFRPSRRIEARKAVVHPDGSWELHDGEERLLKNTHPADRFKVRTYSFPETIQGFIEGETPPEEMTFTELSGYVKDIRQKGYDARKHETDMHAKLSWPLLNILIATLAVPFALRGPRTGGIWRSIGLGLLVGFACWVILSASLSLGKKGIFSPLVAAWLPGALFMGAGATLFRIRR
ncbi:MAG: LPS export ABC transporter permease LptG [Syntrophorhabdaceae bacterium]|nr:LPS export ABC transporter permease LptG [Syntrophorhabdaceae bacterium]